MKNRRIPLGSDPTPINNPFAALDPKLGTPESGKEQESVQEEPKTQPPRKPKLGRVVLRREKSGRGGKTVVVVDQFPSHLPLRFLQELCTGLKQHLGSGGTLKGRTIEIQGDQPARVREFLLREGFQVGGV